MHANNQRLASIVQPSLRFFHTVERRTLASSKSMLATTQEGFVTQTTRFAPVCTQLSQREFSILERIPVHDFDLIPKTELLWTVMKYLLRYLSGTKEHGLMYSEIETEDSDYASNKDTRKSTTAFYFCWSMNL